MGNLDEKIVNFLFERYLTACTDYHPEIESCYEEKLEGEEVEKRSQLS